MKYISRHIEPLLQKASKDYPVISLTGPRQSGKTTLVKKFFDDYDYVNLEDPEQRAFATSDPKGFLSGFSKKLVIDEAQYVPELFSYIQLIVDERKEKGLYILTGSQNFNLIEKISQSLAGRVAIFNLLPFSLEELRNRVWLKNGYEYFIFNGFYPRIYDDELVASDWFSNYLQSYVERDVRQILGVGDVIKLQQFLQLCAGRVGQLINFSEIGNELGVSYHTVNAWLSVLETSFIVFRLPPYHRNFNKRIIKSSKLYFYDVGLAAFLLRIKNADEIHYHFAKGQLFENLIIAEMKKHVINSGLNTDLYFWRDSSGNELDCILESTEGVKAIEIKSGKTIVSDFFKGISFWNKLNPSSKNYLIYGGDNHQKRQLASVYSWKDISKVFES